MEEKFIIDKWLVEKSPISPTWYAYSVIDTSLPQLGTTDWLREMVAVPEYIVPGTTPEELQKKWDAWASTTALFLKQKFAQAARLSRRATRERYKMLGILGE